MKKINYLITIIISVCFFNIKGQNNVADFENLTLSPESYWNGSDSSGISLATKYTSKFVAVESNLDKLDYYNRIVKY